MIGRDIVVRTHLTAAVKQKKEGRKLLRKSAPGHRSRSHARTKTDKIDVGSRLKALRMERNLSQRDLAASSGVTNGMISMIEQNKHSPSIATLNRITDALGLSVGEFFSTGEAVANPKIFFTPQDLIKLVDGKLELSAVAGERHTKALQILYEVYHPGGDTGPDMLSHPGEEGGVIISGEVEVMVGDKTQILRAGDAYYFDSHIPHRFRNTGTVPAVLVSACTPPF